MFVTLSFIALLSFAESVLRVEHVGENPPALDRAKKVGEVTTRRVAELFEKRERQAQGTPEAAVYAKGRRLGSVVLSVSTCVFSALKQYSGPAKEYVNPLAEKVLSVLPEQRETRDESELQAEPIRPTEPTADRTTLSTED